MERLSDLAALSILNKAGARRVNIERKRRDILAWFTFAGIGHVWRIRSDAFKDNFERDVARELGANAESQAA
jgi:hypothetical protein